MPNYLFVPQPSPPRSPSPSDMPVPQPPRPANSWMIYRSQKRKELGSNDQRFVSSEVAKMWANETTEVRQHFADLAEQAKIDHKAKYPNYKYRPQKRNADKPKKTARGKSKPTLDKGEGSSKSGAGSSSSIDLKSRNHPYAFAHRPHHIPYDPLGPSPPMSAASSPSPRAGHPYAFGNRPQHIPYDPLGPSPPMSAACSPPPTRPSSPVAGLTHALSYEVPQTVEWESTNSSCGHLPHEHIWSCILPDVAPATSLQEHPDALDISVGALAMPSDSEQLDIQGSFDNEEHTFDYDQFLGDGLQFDDALFDFGSLNQSGASQSSADLVASSWAEYLQAWETPLDAPV